ncbi:MAG: hypothetical protein IJR42_04140 [Paludibacteraceae bacterium]|nr:hypothetical protein [Paludibacteraceae bacterium]
MRKILLFAAALLTVTTANAKVWRINYDDNAKADFLTITDACTAAKVADTDTLYCEPCLHNGAAAANVISRNGMTVLGPGWGYEPNYGNTSTIPEACFANTIQITTNNVKVEGIKCNSAIYVTGLHNIVINRCNVASISTNARALENFTISNSIIKGVINGAVIYFSGDYSSTKLHNVYITNNIIHNLYNYSDSRPCISVESYLRSCTYNLNILHNTIIGLAYKSDGGGVISVTNALIQDNIIINTANQTFVMDFNNAGNVIRKNVFSLNAENVNAVISEAYSDNYYVGATIANTFTCKENAKYRTEEYYLLRDDSHAKNAAYDGGDCGAFGGVSPYVICGRPQGIPYIYDVEVPAQPTDNKLRVSFKVKSQNE